MNIHKEIVEKLSKTMKDKPNTEIFKAILAELSNYPEAEAIKFLQGSTMGKILDNNIVWPHEIDKD